MRDSGQRRSAPPQGGRLPSLLPHCPSLTSVTRRRRAGQAPHRPWELVERHRGGTRGRPHQKGAGHVVVGVERACVPTAPPQDLVKRGAQGARRGRHETPKGVHGGARHARGRHQTPKGAGEGLGAHSSGLPRTVRQEEQSQGGGARRQGRGGLRHRRSRAVQVCSGTTVVGQRTMGTRHQARARKGKRVGQDFALCGPLQPFALAKTHKECDAGGRDVVGSWENQLPQITWAQQRGGPQRGRPAGASVQASFRTLYS